MNNKDKFTKAIKAGKILSNILKKTYAELIIGKKAIEIDEYVKKIIYNSGATPSFLNYQGFPASSCISFNEEIVHGIPNQRIIQQGDLVKVDIGLFFEGIHVDAAFTKPIGKVSKKHKNLIEVCRKALKIAQAVVNPNIKTGDLGYEIQQFVEKNGFSVIRDYCGHGIGEKLHMHPQIPNFGTKNTGFAFELNSMIAVEPMITTGGYKTVVDENNWTVRTQDGSFASHFETTFYISETEIIDLVPFIINKS